MYVPRVNAMTDDDKVRAMVAAARTAWFVTSGADGVPVATLVPVIWRGSTVVAHVARANPQWRQIDPGSPGLMIVTGPDAYVSPSWYAAKAEHGKVVPTWNYSAVHLTGSVQVHHESAWILDVVTALTDVHEGSRAEPWRVTDAPADFVDTQLKAIVGIELAVERVDATSKHSQNRSEADQRGVIAGLLGDDDGDAASIAAAMDRRLDA